MKKIFTLLILLLLLPVTAGTQGDNHTDHEDWTQLTQITGNTLSAGKYYLSDDLTCNITGQSEITIEGEVTLCLNGHVLNLNGQILRVGSGATLHLCDCNPTTPHKFTVGDDGLWKLDENGDKELIGGVITGGAGRSSGGVYVEDSFEMSGGNIVGNTATYGGGVYVGGSFKMSGGNIVGNTATSGGGGVYMSAGGMFEMSGGNIVGNTTTDFGGGVYVEGVFGGSFKMSGGNIAGNTARNGGGVYVGGVFEMSGGSIAGNTATYGGGVYVGGVFTISGAPNITGNTKTDSSANNVYLEGFLAIGEDGLTEGAKLGVTLRWNVKVVENWNFLWGNPAEYFTSDDSGYGVGLDDQGNVVLASTETKYSVTLNTYGGMIAEGKDIASYTFGTGTKLPTEITKTGYTFAGWYEKEDLSGDPVTEIPSYAVGNKQYWAKWTANTYTVTFEANGGTGSMDDQTFTYGVAQNLTENTFTRTGYTFTGWNTQADGNGTSYADGVDGSQMPADNGGTVILYAQWTINTYKITVQVANGCEDMGEVSGGGTFEYGTTVPLSATAKSGYQFVKWEEDGETSVTREITVTDNAIYTARFEIFYPVSNITLDKTELSLSIGDSEALTATIEPNNATNKNVTWSSNNEAVATVDNGKVTAVKEGTATITATAQDGSGVSASCSVTVTHNMVHTPKKDATCTEAGNKEYWYCETCGKYFSDEAGTTEIKLEDVVIPATGHHYVNGYCTKCGHRDPDYRPDPISYYNIYVEDVCDGVEVTLSNNVVREGNSISVYVKKDTANYTFDNFKVYYKRSYYGTWDELKEGVQPGEYPIKNIWNHIYIKAEGAKEKEDPTGIESIEGVKVYTKDGSLYVQTPQREQVIIVSMSGAIVKNEEQVGLKQYHGLQPGIYIVRVGDKAYKLRLN